MSVMLNLILIAAGVALAVFCGWRGARPPDPRRGPRLIPWRLLMLLSAAGAFTLLVHMVQAARSGG